MDISPEICQVVAHKALNDYKNVGEYVESVHAKMEERGHLPVFNLAIQFIGEFLEATGEDDEDLQIMLLYARNFALAATCMAYESMFAAQEVHDLNEQFA
jgi:hypothetical protein